MLSRVAFIQLTSGHIKKKDKEEEKKRNKIKKKGKGEEGEKTVDWTVWFPRNTMQLDVKQCRCPEQVICN